MINELIDPRKMYVVKANSLIQNSRFSLSLQQQKIILYLISKIQPTDTEFSLYEFSITEFCRVCGIDYDNGKNYIDIRDQIKAIRDKSIVVDLGNGKEATLAWIEKAYFDKAGGLIQIRLDRDMMPFLLQLKEHYTQYQLVYTLRFKSRYSVRLYELAQSYQYSRMGDRYEKYFEVDDLRARLGAEKYTRFCDFNKYVLQKAVDEVNRYTDIRIDCQQVSRGRKTIGINFTVEVKDAVERLRIDAETDRVLGTDQLSLFPPSFQNKR